MNDGWIKLHRRIIYSDAYRALNLVQRDVLLQCLLAAGYETKEWQWKGQGFHLRPGQFVTSLQSLRKKCAEGITIMAVRVALQRLEREGFLTSHSSRTGRIITICHWADTQYSTDDNKESTGLATDFTTPTNKSKERKEKKKRENIPAPVFISSDKDNSNSTDSTGSSDTATLAQAQLVSRLRAAYSEHFPHYQYTAYEDIHLEELTQKFMAYVGDDLKGEQKAERIIQLFAFMLPNLPPWMQERAMTTLPDLNKHFNKITAYFRAQRG